MKRIMARVLMCAGLLGCSDREPGPDCGADARVNGGLSGQEQSITLAVGGLLEVVLSVGGIAGVGWDDPLFDPDRLEQKTRSDLSCEEPRGTPENPLCADCGGSTQLFFRTKVAGVTTLTIPQRGTTSNFVDGGVTDGGGTDGGGSVRPPVVVHITVQ